MKSIIPFIYIFAMISVLLMSSCSSTSLTSVRMDTAYQGGALKNVLIIGVIQPEKLRIFFEEETAQRLKEKGVKAIPSHTVFPDETMPERKQIESKIKELGIDSVLVARLVDIADISAYETYSPYASSTEAELFSFYAMCCQNVISTGYTVKFETKIFGAKNDNLIWSASSETMFKRSPQGMIESLAGAIVKDLSEKKLLP